MRVFYSCLISFEMSEKCFDKNEINTSSVGELFCGKLKVFASSWKVERTTDESVQIVWMKKLQFELMMRQ